MEPARNPETQQFTIDTSVISRSFAGLYTQAKHTLFFWFQFYHFLAPVQNWYQDLLVLEGGASSTAE